MNLSLSRSLSWVVVASLSSATGVYASALDHNPLESILSVREGMSAEKQLEKIIKSDFLTDSDSSLQVIGAVENDGFTTIKARQLHKGVPVLGTLASIERGNEDSFFANLESLTISTTPRVSTAQAISIARTFTKNPIVRAPELAILPSTDRSANRLAYWVDVPTTDFSPGVEIVIDALNGNVIAEVPKMHTAEIAPITVMDAKEEHMIMDLVWESTPAPVVNGPSPTPAPRAESDLSSETMLAATPAPVSNPKLLGCTITDPVTGRSKYLDSEDKCNNFARDLDADMRTRCQIVTKDGIDKGRAFPIMYDPRKCTFAYVSSKPNGVPSVAAKKAFENTKSVLEYLRDELARDSFDGKGKGIISVVNAGFKLANAAWFSDRDMMIYGSGDGVDFGDFTQLVDVAGHEMTHGVVSKTANLTYMDESGALNEAVADFFGKMIAKENHWLIGKGLYKNDPAKGLRSLEKPSMYDARFISQNGTKSKKPYPESVSQKFQSFGECNEDNDRCYVHVNSTIVSHAFYKMHQALGRDKSQKIIYNALIRYMTSLSNFRGAASAIRKSCSDLYDSASCGLVDSSLKAVGM